MSFVSDSDSRLRAVGAGVGVGILGIVVALVLVAIAGLVVALTGVSLSPLLLIALSLLLMQGVSFMGVGYAYLRWRGIPLRRVGLRVPSLKEVGVVVGALVLSVVYLVVVGLLLQSTGTQTASNQVVELGVENPEVLLLLIPGAYLLIGPGEELLFRGVVQGRLRETFSPVPGVIIASVIFAAIHVTALQAGAPLTAKLTTLTVLMGPSLILGSVYEYTGNLVASILVHGTYDAILFAGLYFAVKSGAIQALV